MGGAGYASICVSKGAGVRQYVTLMGRGAISARALPAESPQGLSLGSPPKPQVTSMWEVRAFCAQSR